MEYKNGDVTSAAAEAVRLWEACEAEIEKWPSRVAEAKTDLELHESLVRDAKQINSLGPVSFDNALKRMMPKVKAPDRMARFRSYLMAYFKCDKMGTGEIIIKLRAQDWSGRCFRFYSDGFAEWWRNEVSEKRRRSGSRARRKSKRPA